MALIPNAARVDAASFLLMPATEGIDIPAPGPDNLYQPPTASREIRRNARIRLRRTRREVLRRIWSVLLMASSFGCALVKSGRIGSVDDLILSTIVLPIRTSACARFFFRVDGGNGRSNSKLICLRLGSIVTWSCRRSSRSSAPFF